MSKVRWTRAVVLSIALASAASAARAATITSILGPQGQLVLQPGPVLSGDGSVVAGGVNVPNPGFGVHTQTVRWEPPSAPALLPGPTIPDGQQPSSPGAISQDGSTIVGQIGPLGTAGQRIGRWTQAGGWQPLSGVPALAGDVWDVSADGSTVAGYLYSGVGGFVWSDANGYQPIFGNLLSPRALSGDASVIAGVRNTQTTVGGRTIFEAFRWTEMGGVENLGFLNTSDFMSVPHGISADGSAIVGESCLASGGGGALTCRGFRWTEALGLEDVGPGTAFDVSGDGGIVVGTRNGFLGEASIWDPVNGSRNLEQVLQTDYGLDLGGWQLHVATAISDDGTRIAGLGTTPSGHYTGFLVDLVAIPEPSTALLLGAALAMLARGRRG